MLEVVAALSGEVILVVPASATIDDIKARIETRTGIPQIQQRLLVANNQFQLVVVSREEALEAAYGKRPTEDQVSDACSCPRDMLEQFDDEFYSGLTEERGLQLFEAAVDVFDILSETRGRQPHTLFQVRLLLEHCGDYPPPRDDDSDDDNVHMATLGCELRYLEARVKTIAAAACCWLLCSPASARMWQGRSW